MKSGSRSNLTMASLKHILREGNAMADKLPNSDLDRAETFIQNG